MLSPEQIAKTDRALYAACAKVQSDIPPASARHREATVGVIDATMDLALAAKKSQAKSNSKLKAIRLEDGVPEDATIAQFQAFKPA